MDQDKSHTTNQGSGFLSGQGIPKTSFATPEGREGLRGVIVNRHFADFIGNRQLNSLFIRWLKQPFWNRDVWHNMYRNIHDRVRDFDKDKPNDFFTTFPELELSTNETTTSRVQALVHYVQWYFYLMVRWITYSAQALMWLEIRGLPISERSMQFLKWSKMNTMMSTLKGMPWDKALAQWILDHMHPLVDINAANGTALTMPLWLGPEDAWVDEPMPFEEYAEGAQSDVFTDQTQFAGVDNHRPFMYSEMHANYAGGTFYDDRTDDAWEIYPLLRRCWYKGNVSNAAASPSNSGSLVGWIYNMALTSKNNVTTKFKYNSNTNLNILEPGNYLRRFMQQDLGLFTDEFDPSEWSTMVRSVPVMDFKDYFARNYGYLSKPSPILRSYLITSGNTLIPDQTTYGGVGPSLLQPFGSDDDNYFEYSTEHYLQLGFDTDMATAANSEEIPYMMVGGKTATGIDEMRDQQTWFVDDDFATEHVLYGCSDDLGSLTVAGTNTDFVHYYDTAGKSAFVRQFQRLANNGYQFAKSKDEIPEMLTGDQNWQVERSAFEQGLLVWRHVTHSPIIDPNDFYQHGVFCVLSTERVSQPGEWSHAFQADLIFAPDPSDTYSLGNQESTTGQGTLDVSGTAGHPWVTDHDHLGDLIGPFIGDSIDQSVNMHFARHDLARYAQNGLVPDASPCLIPVKPFTQHYPVRVRDILPGAELDHHGTGIVYDSVTGHDYAMTNTSTNNNDIDAAMDKRHYGILWWDPRSSFSETLPVQVTIQNFVYEGFKRARDLTTPEGIKDMIMNLSPTPDGSPATIDTAVRSVLDVFIPKRGPRDSSSSRSGGGKRDSGGRRSNSRKSKSRSSKGKNKSFDKPKFSKKDDDSFKPKFDKKEETFKPDEMSEVDDKKKKFADAK